MTCVRKVCWEATAYVSECKYVWVYLGMCMMRSILTKASEVPPIGVGCERGWVDVRGRVRC